MSGYEEFRDQRHFLMKLKVTLSNIIGLEGSHISPSCGGQRKEAFCSHGAGVNSWRN